MRFSYSNISLLLGLLCLAAYPSNAAQLVAADVNGDAYPIPLVPSLEGAIQLDGALDEPLWEKALQISLDYEVEPGENKPAAVRTRMYLFEDGATLYVAFEADDPDPSKIRAYLRERDEIWNDDYVGILIDPFNDNRRAYGFLANPLGIQSDISRNEDNGDYDDSWDAIWEVTGRIHDRGYTVEFAIPLSQFRFPLSAGEQVWKVYGARNFPRSEGFEFATTPVERGNNCRICQYKEVRGFAGAKPTKDIEIVPTVTLVRADVADDTGSGGLVNGNFESDQGVSIRWGITPDVTASFAINPDFSQVEADVAQLNINQQFALYFPEKRSFFLEGADYFSTPINAVFTRTVADPRYGAKLTGRRGDHTFGMFVAEDEITNLIFPGTFGSDSDVIEARSRTLVTRYSHNFESANAGVLLTNRQGTDYQNTVGGFDGNWNVTKQDNIRVQMLRSETEYPQALAAQYDQPTGRFSGSGTSARYLHEGQNWFWFTMYRQFDDEFRADNGFVPRVGHRWQMGGLGRNWWGTEKNWWNRIKLRADWDISHDDAGQVLEREAELRFEVLGSYSSNMSVGISNGQRRWNGVMYKGNFLNFAGSVAPLRGLNLGIMAWGGEEVDTDNNRLADSLTIRPLIEWNVNKHLLLRFNYVKSTLDTREGSSIYDATLLDGRATWHFNARSFFRLTIQDQDIKRNQDEYLDAVDLRDTSRGLQLLYSYELNPQTVFFLGYSDNHSNDGTFMRNAMTDRTFFMKIGYAWMPEATFLQ